MSTWPAISRLGTIAPSASPAGWSSEDVAVADICILVVADGDGRRPDDRRVYSFIKPSPGIVSCRPRKVSPNTTLSGLYQAGPARWPSIAIALCYYSRQSVLKKKKI